MELDSSAEARPRLWKILLLLALTVLSYTSALKGGYIWDDDDYVTTNKTLETAGGLARIWTEPHASPQYYPLVFTTFWIERQVWGLNPFGYHLVNVLFHACTACLLYYLLLLLQIPGAWLAAMVFAVHPVNVETVAWISERKNVLAGFFYMLSSIALLRFYGVGRLERGHEEREGGTKNTKNMTGGQGEAAHSTAAPLRQDTKRTRGRTKSPLPPFRKGGKVETAFNTPAPPEQTLKKRARGERETNHPPFVRGGRGVSMTDSDSPPLLKGGWGDFTTRLRGFIACPSRAFEPGTSRENLLCYFAGLLLFGCALLSKTVTCTLPAALLVVLWWKRGRVTLDEALSLAPLFVVGAGMGLLTAWLEHTHVGAHGADWGLSFIERFLVAGRVLWFYAWKLLWPANLCFNYERWVIDGRVWWQYLYPLAAAVVLLTLWLARGRIGRGPLAAALFFAITLFPALGFFDVFPFRYSYVADHFQYFATIGPITLAVAAVCRYVSKHHREHMRPFIAAAAVIVSILAVITWRQGNMYADAWTLWSETLSRNPGSIMAHNNIGSLLSKQGKHQEAMAHFEEALRVRPEFEITNYNVSMTYYNMGVELATQGMIDEAIEHYEKALRVRPDFARALNNLGSLLAQKERIDDAVRCWAKAVEIKPDYAGAHYNLLLGYTQLGDSVAARRQLDRIKSLDPALAEKARQMVQGMD
ncbi:membrane hypothetical protein [Syntrophobacter sp. SbD1]|nr:membrane hypothetical protein [Syntrophobacter sp. SbD1]